MLGFIIEQIDIVGAYLESLLSDNDLPIYMRLPSGFQTFRPILVCRLLRSIYLRQSGRLWNQKVVKGLGFHPLNANASILIHHGKDKDDITMMSPYVDNFVIAAKCQSSMEWIKTHLKGEYNVKDLREVKTITGWQVTRDLVAGTLKIDQSAFVRDLLEEEDLVDCNSVSIPMKAGSVIEMNDADDYEETDLKAYQRLIGKLMYL